MPKRSRTAEVPPGTWISREGEREALSLPNPVLRTTHTAQASKIRPKKRKVRYPKISIDMKCSHEPAWASCAPMSMNYLQHASSQSVLDIRNLFPSSIPSHTAIRSTERSLALSGDRSSTHPVDGTLRMCNDLTLSGGRQRGLLMLFVCDFSDVYVQGGNPSKDTKSFPAQSQVAIMR